jgi:Fic family protein
MFKPKFSISPHLLGNIKQISVFVAELNGRSFPKVVLHALEKSARELSSHVSTSIEGNPLPLTEVKKILKNAPANARNSEKEVLNYNKILENLNEKVKNEDIKLDLYLILKIQKEVTNGLIENYRNGFLRNEPVFVNDPKSRTLAYLPPDHKDVEKLMKDLIDFVNNGKEKIDPLIVAGIFHKQFVIIHPFIDGNGRTARLATKLLLAKMGLDTFNLFSFENYYNNNVTMYFEKVGELGNYYDIFEKIDFTNWLEYFTDGVIDELLRVEKELENEVATPELIFPPHLQKILKYVRGVGVIRDKDYAKLVNRSKSSRNLDFNKLIALGFLLRLGKGKGTYYKLK